MSTHLVCPICGGQFECKGPHEKPHDMLSPVKECPLGKGSIHVFVKDSLNQGVPNVRTYCSGDERTGALGFASSEPLDAGDYPTSIALDESGENVKSNYYSSTRTSVTAKVQAGKITMVEFALNKYAAMLVRIERTDRGSELPPADFEVGGSHTPDEPTKPAAKGMAEFSKLKPTELYTVKCKLREEDQKNFKLEKDTQTGQKVTSARLTEVVFRLEPRYWVDLALVDPKDDTVKGSFSVEQSGDTKPANDVGREAKHIPDLKAGKVDIAGITLPESREFVKLT